MKTCLCVLSFFTISFLLLSGSPQALFAADIDGDGFDDGVEFVDVNGDGRHDGLDDITTEETSSNILVVSNENPWAYFGFYYFPQMSDLHKALLIRTINSVGGFHTSSEARILLFTYNDDYELPVTLQQENSFELYQWLLEQGYSSISVLPQWDMPGLDIDYYQDYDLVLYWNSYGYNPENALSSGIPFISSSTWHAQHMEICEYPRSGDRILDFCVVNNDFFPTQVFENGEISFKSSLWIVCMELGEHGVSLITKECTITPLGDYNLGDIRSMFR